MGERVFFVAESCIRMLEKSRLMTFKAKLMTFNANEECHDLRTGTLIAYWFGSAGGVVGDGNASLDEKKSFSQRKQD